ncbi:histidine phosphatase family protein [Psychromarinibacter sp. C21-152]|uniref:Histidine phosphatase family protein n=1 Tax=Psychromarinibacter sediminicola TaxID=3033385 RepID=A0AAE3NV43_9RHOB|nr:histidine phosphatase family protein [Psychromarinibacter sediminicola]MDF0602581.1 histidine phosphatase family protein [Psychromarinibacter sediminicola]
MTLRLILVRHAKSSWKEAALDDHARPLNKRGRRAAEAIGGWLAERGYHPDLVLSSDSARTRETWDRMAPHVPAPLQIVWTPSLYLAGPSAFLHALREVREARTVLMLGHNPGISHFASAIVGVPPRHERFGDYPTCATLVAAFDRASWADVTPGSGRTVDFTVPRELTD